MVELLLPLPLIIKNKKIYFMKNDSLVVRLLAFITLGMMTHYFLSYRTLSKILSPFNLSYTNVLTVDDILFSVAEFNNFILGVVFVLFVFIMIGCYTFKHTNNMEKLHSKIKNYKWIKAFGNTGYLLFFFDVILLGLILWISDYSHFFLLLMIPIAYITTLFRSNDMRDSRLITAILLFAYLFSAQSVKKYPNLYTSSIVLQLKDGSTVSSDSTNTLVFYGSKYIIFKDGNTSNANIYPTSEVESFKWINEKEKHLEVAKKDRNNRKGLH